MARFSNSGDMVGLRRASAWACRNKHARAGPPLRLHLLLKDSTGVTNTCTLTRADVVPSTPISFLLPCRSPVTEVVELRGGVGKWTRAAACSQARCALCRSATVGVVVGASLVQLRFAAHVCDGAWPFVWREVRPAQLDVRVSLCGPVWWCVYVCVCALTHVRRTQPARAPHGMVDVAVIIGWCLFAGVSVVVTLMSLAFVKVRCSVVLYCAVGPDTHD